MRYDRHMNARELILDHLLQRQASHNRPSLSPLIDMTTDLRRHVQAMTFVQRSVLVRRWLHFEYRTHFSACRETSVALFVRSLMDEHDDKTNEEHEHYDPELMKLLEKFKAKSSVAHDLFLLYVRSQPEKKEKLIRKTNFILSILLIGVRYWREHLHTNSHRHARRCQIEWNTNRKVFQIVMVSSHHNRVSHGAEKHTQKQQQKIGEKTGELDWIRDVTMMVNGATERSFFMKLFSDQSTNHNGSYYYSDGGNESGDQTVKLNNHISYSTLDPITTMQYLGYRSDILLNDRLQLEREMKHLIREWIEKCKERLSDEANHDILKDYMTDFALSGLEQVSDSTLAMIACSIIQSRMHFLYYILGERYARMNSENSSCTAGDDDEDIKHFMDDYCRNTVSCVQQRQSDNGGSITRKDNLDKTGTKNEDTLSVHVKCFNVSSSEEALRIEKERTLEIIENDIKNLIQNSRMASRVYQSYSQGMGDAVPNSNMSIKDWLSACCGQTIDPTATFLHETVPTQINRFMQVVASIHAQQLFSMHQYGKQMTADDSARTSTKNQMMHDMEASSLIVFDAVDYESREQLIAAIKDHMQHLYLQSQRRQLEERIHHLTSRIATVFESQSHQSLMNREKNRIFENEYSTFAAECKQREERNRRLRILCEVKQQAEQGTHQRLKHQVDQALRSQAIMHQFPVLSIFQALLEL